AAGGIYSTAGDLARWDLGLISGKVLKPDSYRLMTAPRELTSGKTQDYGCGLQVNRQGGDTILAHTGAVCGFHAYNPMVPRTKSAVIVLSNAEHVDAGAVQRELLALLLRDQAKREENVPKVQGLPAKEAAAELFHQMQEGKLDRGQLGEEFSIWLTEDR